MRRAGLLSVIPFLFSCGGPDYGATTNRLQALGSATLSKAVPAAERASGLAEDISLEVVELPWVDTNDQGVQPRCFLRYGISDDQWGVVPGSMHECDDADAITRQRKAARLWLQHKLLTRTDAAAVKLASFEDVASFVQEARGLVNEAAALDMEFDLERCVDEQIGALGSVARERAELSCEIFQSPGYRLAELEDRIDSAAEHAQQRLDDSASRRQPSLSAETVQRCSAAVGVGVLEVPGEVQGQLEGGAVAYAIHAFAGETLTVDLMSDSFDPVLEIFDADCAQRIGYNDDGGRGNNSRIRKHFSQDTDVVLVARSLRGRGGPYSFYTSVEGIPVLTESQKQQLAEFVAWAGGMTEQQLLAAWRAQAGGALQGACLDDRLMEIGAVNEAFVAEAALEGCVSDLGASLEIHRAALQTRAGALGALSGFMRKLSEL